MRSRLLSVLTLIMLLVGMVGAQAQNQTPPGPSDPNILAEYQGQVGWQDTKQFTLRSSIVNTSIRNLILFNAGQSNSTNILPTAVAPTNASKVNVFNVYDGATYNVIAGPILGTQGYTGSTGAGTGGAIITQVADLLVTNNKFDQVYLVPLAISGTPAAAWGQGGALYDRICVAVRRLAARGIVPGTNVTFALVWMQGEADGAGGTTAVAYQASINQMIAKAQGCGFSGRWFISKETWSMGVVYPVIQNAQWGLANGTTIFQGGDLDTINSGGRYDNIHFNDSGGATAATLTYNALVASGAPF